MQKKATQSKVGKSEQESRQKQTGSSARKATTKPKASVKEPAATAAKISVKPAAKPVTSKTTASKAVAKAAAPKAASANTASATRTTTKKAPPAATKFKTSGTVKLVEQEDANQMMTILCKRYPDAECELTHKNDFELLTSVILSAQTTDAQVNKVTPALFTRFPTPKSLAEADIEEVKQIVRPTGYYNAKAKSIQDCAIGIVTKFGGKIPKTLEELVTLPGVGRKTANVVLGVLHGESAWTVDTHVQRLSHRFGFTTETDPYKIELALQKLFPNDDWSKFSITIIWHGRRTCFAKNPNCTECPINHLCPSSSV